MTPLVISKNRDLKGDSRVFKARFKLKLALARFILTTIELLCLFTKIKDASLKIKIVFIKRKMEKKS